MRRTGILALLLAGTTVPCLMVLRHGLTQSTGLRRLTNTTEEGINLNPSISGDGRIVAFESTEDVAAAGGSDHFRAIRANIGFDPATFFQMGGTRAVAPAISQDGSRIAFASKDDPLGTNPDGNSEIFLFDGAKLIQVTNTSPGSLGDRVTNGNFQPSISDDGRFIAFSSNRDLASQNADTNLEIFVYDATANTFSQLTNSSGIVGCSDAKISGDGSTVAFIRDPGTSPSAARDLVKQPRVGPGSPTVLAAGVQSLAMTYGRAISDDGLRVVYSAQTATNTTQVFLFDGRTGGVNRQITSLGARVTEVPLHPTISGDGSRIAFATRRSVSGAASNSDGGVELYTYDLPTAAFSKITNAPSSATADVVSSLNDDGSIVAFNFPRILSGAVTNSGTENNSEIYVTGPPPRPANGTLTAILNDASFAHEPSTVKAAAPDSIAAAQGTNLANTTLQSQRLSDGTFPTNVAGTRVTVSGRAAQIFFVSPAQVNFLVPPQTEIGTAEVIVTNGENFPSRGTVPTLRAAPGIFTRTGDGIGEGLILNSDTLQEGPFDPTSGNLHLSIFTTGARNAIQTTVSIGGRLVNAESVIPSPNMPGLDEVHVRVPSDLRGAGTVNLSINSDGRDSNPVTVSFLGDPGRAILFNEVLADPPTGDAGDANHDGVRDGTQDEFVELVNGSSGDTIGMSGWTIKTRATGSTTETTRFTFPTGTSLPAGESAVIFGGGTFNPTDPIFGCAQVFKATSASSGLSLTNSGLTILVRDSAGNLIAQFSYGGSTGLDGSSSQSLTRSPDVTGSFVLHTAALNANGRKFSPGLRTDGTPFGNCPGKLTSVSLTPANTSIVVGQTTQFTARALDQFGRTMTGISISFASDNTNVATIDSSSTTAGVATVTVRSKNPGTAHITATATDGTTTVNSSPSNLTVTGPSLSINDVSLREGNSGTTTFTFTVSLSTPAPAPVTFDIATQDNTATVADNDYVARSLTAQTILTGQQTYSFDVTVNGDLNMEPSESFFVNVNNVTGASVADGQGLGTIVSDDIPLLSVNDVSLNEGNSGTTTFAFTVSSSMPAPAGGITFDIATADGTATAGSDYVARSLTSQTIPAGQSSYTFNVNVNGDSLVEPNETFLVNLSNVSSNAAIADGQGQGTIQNDDTALLVISQVYPGGGLTNASFTNDFIELYNRGTTTVDFSLTPYSLQFLNTTATTWGKTDLTAGTLAPGHYFLIKETSGGSTGAALPAADATGTLNITSTSAGKVALVSGTTLLAGNCPGDDGVAPFNAVANTIADLVGYAGTASTANHCYEGSGPAIFTLSNNTIADYRKAGGCVDTNDNAADFFVAQPNPRNSSSPIGDCRPEITISDVSKNEGNSGTTSFTFTVSLSAASTQTVTVDYATADGTASTPSDYQSINSTLTFGPGDLTKTITILVNGDTTNEANETFFVNLTNATNAVLLDNQGQGTINNDDALPSLSINDVSVAEGDSGTTSLNFTVSLSAASGQTVTVNYATADNTAAAGSDYQSTSGTLTFNPSDTAKTITVLVNGDTTFEQNETFFVNLTSPVNASISDTQGVGTITNDDAAPATPTLFINDVSVAEGDSGTSTATFTVTLTPTSSSTVTVNYATANGSATIAGNDYQSASGQLTFNPGDTTKTIDVTINGDTLVEPDENFTVGLSGASGAGIGTPSGTGTIQNDDTPLIVISQVYPGGGLTGASFTNDYIELFNRGTTTVDFSITPFSVQFLSTGGSTWAKTDLTSGTMLPGHYFLIKEAGGATGAPLPTADATGSINITSTTDGKVALVSGTTLLTGNCPGDDGTQPFNPTNMIDFVGYGGTAATANHCYEGSGPASFTLSNNTIADYRKAGGCTDTNDNAADFFTSTPSPRNSSATNNCAGGATPNLSINDVTVAEGNSGTVTAAFTVSLSAPAQGTDVTFDIATADGTATTVNSDYVAKSLTNQVIPAGQTTYTFSVTINGDTNVEPDETFFVNVSNLVGANGTDSQGQGTIQNDDVPSLSINDVPLNEGNSGTTTFSFTVSLSSPAPAGGVTFDIATQDGTATVAENDYVAKSLTSQTIPAGQSTYVFDVAVNGDLNIESNETFFVNVTSISGATAGDTQGQGTIVNDDSPVLSINDVSRAEGNSGTTTFTFTVTSTLPAPAGGITFDIATADGTAQDHNPASEDNDYVAKSLPAQTIPAGQSTYTFDVTVNGDKIVEPDETFNVVISNASGGGATIGDNTGVGTIQNDDTPLIVISQVYGGGGNTTSPAAVLKNDFIEIFNRGTTTVDLAGWSVQYSSAGGTGSWSVTPLCAIGPCVLTPGKYFLVQEAQGTAGTQNLPTPDATGSIAMATATGKVALVTNISALTGACPSGANILDQVGYGGTSSTTDFCFEGSGPTPAPSNVNAAFRKSDGCTDTNDNSADFLVATANPRNTSSAINDCNAPPLLTINDVSATEGNSSTKTFTFTVSLSKPALAGGVTFDIATANDTAAAGSDYVANSATGVLIGAGLQTATFDVTVNGDTTVEPDETFFVNVTNVTGATVVDGQGLGTIQNDDSPSLSIDDVTVTEGNSGTTPAVFTVTLTPSSTQTVTVNYATSSASPATAAAGTDYVTTSGMLTFNPGDTTKQITVQVNGDTTNEAICETYFVKLSSAVNATILDDTGQGGITDDDGTKVVISQVYGGGNNSGASYQNDFIEIFNRGNTSVSLNGWSVQYASDTGTTWAVTSLTNVTLQAGQYYLVKEAGGTTNGSPLPTPDATGTTNMSGTAGKVALVNSTTALSGSCPSSATIIDFIGYGTTAACREGATTSDNAPAPSNTTSDIRKQSGCQDTNLNATDFQALSPAPRNTATALSTCSCSTSYSSMFILDRESWKTSLATLFMDHQALRPTP